MFPIFYITNCIGADNDKAKDRTQEIKKMNEDALNGTLETYTQEEMDKMLEEAEKNSKEN